MREGVRRLTCSSRGCRYRSMRRQHGASACSRSSRAQRGKGLGGNKLGLGLGGGKQAGPGLWKKLRGKEASAEPRGSEHRAGGRGPTGGCGRGEPWAGWSGKAHAADSRHRPTRVRLRGSAERAAVYLGLRTGARGPLGIVVLCPLGPRQGSGFCALILGGEEAEAGGREWASLGFSTIELQLPAGLAGVEGRPGREPASESGPVPSLEARPGPSLWDNRLRAPVGPAFETVLVFNAARGHRWAALCPKDRKKALTLGDVSDTGFSTILTSEGEEAVIS